MNSMHLSFVTGLVPVIHDLRQPIETILPIRVLAMN